MPDRESAPGPAPETQMPPEAAPGTGAETPAARLGRLRARSMYRGIREMDLILRDFASRELAALGPADLDRYESLLEETDHDLLAWITGAAAAPDRLAPLLDRIRAGAVGIARG